MAGDLHTHSTFSDGSTDIEFLPIIAARAGLNYLAVSDHDTSLGIQYAQENPVKSGVFLIPAVEFSCYDTKRDRKVHMLCYYPNITKKMQNYFDLIAKRRNDTGMKSIETLEKLYPQFTRQAVESFSVRNKVLYKTSMIRVLFELGYTDGIYKDLYKELFVKEGAVALNEPVYESVESILEIIKECGGVAVLAHPSVYNSIELCEELAQNNMIDGVEINHARNTEKDKEALRKIALKYNLLVTGGTDFHGMHMSRPLPLGAITTDDDTIEQIKKLAHLRKAK